MRLPMMNSAAFAGVDRCPAPGRSHCVSADVTQPSLYNFTYI